MRPKPDRIGKGEAEFKAEFARDFKSRTSIKTLLEQLGDSWMKELDFMREAKVSATNMGRIRDEFAEHWLMTSGRNPKRIWCGTKEFAKKLREHLGEHEG